MSAARPEVTPLSALLWAIGVLYAAAVGYALYLGWDAWTNRTVNQLILTRDGFGPLTADLRWLRGFEQDLRLPLQVIVFVLATSLADWLWRMTLGRLQS